MVDQHELVLASILIFLGDHVAVGVLGRALDIMLVESCDGGHVGPTHEWPRRRFVVRVHGFDESRGGRVNGKLINHLANL
jgi:hypothetical protein